MGTAITKPQICGIGFSIDQQSVAVKVVKI